MFRIKTLLALALLLTSQAGQAGELVHLNAADAARLAAGMVGIGPAKAAAIVAHREHHGPFKTGDELQDYILQHRAMHEELLRAMGEIGS